VAFDAVARRYFPGIVCGLLALVAYFQGSGIGSLIAEHLPATPSPPLASSADRSKKLPSSSHKTGAAILSRNPFDSVTGPLSGKAPVPTVAKPTTEPRAGGEPPTCPKGDVTLIAGALDPSYSFAVISTGNETKMRRIGDEVDGKTVESIGGERVVLASGTDRCQLKMHEGTKSPATPGMIPSPRDSEGGESLAPATRGSASISGIKKVSETEYILEENGAQKLVQMQQGLMKSAKLVDGKGLRLYRAAQTTILGNLGLKKGDIVKTINGFDMSSLDETANAYSNMKTAKNLQVVVERDGKPITIDYTIK